MASANQARTGLELALCSGNSQSTASNFANNPALLATEKARLVRRICGSELAYLPQETNRTARENLELHQGNHLGQLLLNLSNSHATKGTNWLHAGGAVTHSHETRGLYKRYLGPPCPIPLPARSRKEEWGRGQCQCASRASQ